MVKYIKTKTTFEAIPCCDNGYRKDVFIITDKIPKWYRIWNINTNAIDDLGAILEETDEEKARYTKEQAEKMLTTLINRELKKGAAQK